MNDNKESINSESQEAENHHILSPYECGLIVGMYAVEKNTSAFSRQFDFNGRYVRHVIKCFNENGSGIPKTYSGMKRRAVERDYRSLIWDTEKDPEMMLEHHRAILTGTGVTVTLQDN
jgi:hypothetical protein